MSTLRGRPMAGASPSPASVEDRRDIYVMNADGSEVTRLTDSDIGGAHPTWSPDGRRIAFVSYRHGQIYVMNADGSEVTRLTDDDFGGVDAPAWSPDGRHIAFHSYGFNNSIYVMKADGSEVTRLTDNRANQRYRLRSRLVVRWPAHRLRILRPCLRTRLWLENQLWYLRDQRRRLRAYPPHRL